MTVERVLIVGTLGGGGIHRYVEEQYRHLDGHLDVSVYDMVTDWGGEGVWWAVRSFALAVLAAMRFPVRRRPDVVHVHTAQRYSFVRASFYVLFVAHVWRRPVVLHVHGSGFEEFLAPPSTPLGALQSLVFGASDAVVVLSPYWRDVLDEHVPASKIHVLPNAVDPALYDPAEAVDPPHVVFLSNLIARKGVPAFIAAIDELAERRGNGFRVSIAGAGPLSDDVEALADRHHQVTYHGYVSEDEKCRLLDAGSIYVLPAHAEGLPIAILEAMAGGNAIVSTTVGSIPEVVGEDQGRLVAPGDPGVLADAIDALLDDSETVEQMGRRNRRAVLETYSWTDATATLLSLYDEVAGAAQDSQSATDGPSARPVGRADGGTEDGDR